MALGIDPGAGDSSVLAQRLAAQLLSGPPATHVLEVVHRLLAVQGQELRGAVLAVRARSQGLHRSDVHRELTDERSLVLTTLNRGTLHLVCSEDYWWLHPITTPPVATMNTTRLNQLGVSPVEADRALGVITAAIEATGPLTRGSLRAHLSDAGVPTEGQALAHLLLYASWRGLIVRGPMVGAEQAFVLVRDWLGKPPKALAPEVALAELARRFLVGHGPADDRDLARWAGVTLGQARAGLHGIGARLRERADGLLELDAQPGPTGSPPAKLLGPFDPVLFGWKSREPILGDQVSVVTVNGLFRPFAMLRGRAVGTWRMQGNKVEVGPFRPLSVADTTALASEAVAVERFLG